MAPLPDVVTLAFTEQGGAELAADGQSVRLAPRNTALFLPSCEFDCECEPIVSVLVHDSSSQLAATAAALAGPAGAAALPYRLRQPTLIDGSEDPRRPALFASLRRALQLLDQPALLDGNGFAALKLEDLLRRHLALLLWPALLDPGLALPAEAGRDPLLEELLEWIDAHHHEPITLTQLARRSGESVRNLQYRFQRRVGCSPMQWLRLRRLEAVHSELRRAAPEESVAAVARRHGFHHLSGFAACFRRQYGVLPSQLRRAARRGQG
jgi:AraC-like DNA-binding protein